MTKFQRNNVHGRVAWRVFGAALMLVAFVIGSSSCACADEGKSPADSAQISAAYDSAVDQLYARKHKKKKNKKKSDNYNNGSRDNYGNGKQAADSRNADTPSLSSNDRLLIVITEQSLPESLVNYTGFKISFNPRRHTPNWVAWELTAKEAKGRLRRGDDFHRDARIDGCPESWDYNNSGYDRGHMAPAGDMKWNANAMYDCFSMANMCPQSYDLNHGSWRVLEEKCREWAIKFGNIFIICGPVATDPIDKRVGRTGVAVPKRFFKVVLAPDANPARGIGFLMPNKDVAGGLQRCAVTIDEVERVTGHDFFKALPDNIENNVESQCNFYSWER